jgi:hypothetical protein
MNNTNVSNWFTSHENHGYSFDKCTVLVVSNILLWQLPAAGYCAEAVQTNIKLSWLPDPIREGFIAEYQEHADARVTITVCLCFDAGGNAI